MFEFILLLFNVFIPMTVMGVGLLLAGRLARREHPGETPADQADPNRVVVARPLAVMCVTLAAILAIGLAFGLRNGFSWWPEDAWMRLPLGVALVGLGAMDSYLCHRSWMRWGLRVLVVSMAAWLIFPTGASWDFLLPTRTWWLATLILSTCGGWYLIERRQPREAAVLGFGWIALFAAAAVLTAQSFLKVTEPLLAVSAVMGCAALAVFWQRGWGEQVTAVSGPCLFGLSAAVASAQFNSFLGLPDALSWLAMAAPALAALLSWPVNAASSGANRRVWWGRAATLGVCLLLAGVIVGWTLLLAGSGGEDW